MGGVEGRGPLAWARQGPLRACSQADCPSSQRREAVGKSSSPREAIRLGGTKHGGTRVDSTRAKQGGPQPSCRVEYGAEQKPG